MSLSPPLRWSIPAFTVLSLCAVYFVMIQTVKSGALPQFLAVAKSTPLVLKPTSNYLPFVDKALGPLVIFFITAFYDPSSPTFAVAADFAWSFGCISLWQALEAGRVGGSVGQGVLPSILSYVPLWDFVGRRVGWSAVMPIWLLVFLHTPAHARSAPISRVKVESILFGWWIGHNLPFAAVFLAGLESTSVPLYAYALAPAFMHYSAKIYVVLRRSFTDQQALERLERRPGAGYGVLKVAYLSAFVVSALARIHLVLVPAFRSVSSSNKILDLATDFANALRTFFIPIHGLRQPPPEETSAQSGVLRFVQANKTLGFSAVWVALLWDLSLQRASAQVQGVRGSESRKSGKQVGSSTIAVWGLKAVVGLIIVSVCFGPGAATAALLAYRESVLERARNASEKVL